MHIHALGRVRARVSEEVLNALEREVGLVEPGRCRVPHHVRSDLASDRLESDQAEALSDRHSRILLAVMLEEPRLAGEVIADALEQLSVDFGGAILRAFAVDIDRAIALRVFDV